MVTEAPAYVSLLFLALVFALLGLLLGGIRLLGSRAGLRTLWGLQPALAAAAFLSAWLGLLAIAAWNGFFADFSAMPPRLFFIVAPFTIVILAFGFSGAAWRLIAVCPAEWLIYPQSFRVVMEMILWLLFLEGRLPVQMTFEGRNFDVLAGLSAPVIAYLCFTRRTWRPHVAIVWNFLALGLLLNIVSTAILSVPTPFQRFFDEPANTIVAFFPFVWLPGFVVPFAFLLHLLSLRQLLRKPGIAVAA